MGVKRTIQVQKPWGCSKSAITPQQLPYLPWDAKKEDIFTCWESRMMNSLKDMLHRVGEGLKMWQIGVWWSSFCIQMVLQKLGRGGCCSSWTGKALRRIWRHSLPWQPMGCSPSGLMTEVALVGVLRLWKVLSFCQTLLLHNIFPVVLLSKYSLSSSVSPLQKPVCSLQRLCREGCQYSCL